MSLGVKGLVGGDVMGGDVMGASKIMNKRSDRE